MAEVLIKKGLLGLTLLQRIYVWDHGPEPVD